jgi:hypothetical protein
VSGRAAPPGRAGELVAALGLAPHPEGGWYREVFRSAQQVTPHDGRGSRSALTSIDFLLAPGEASAWHRVRSDEAWHLLEGGPLQLWLLSPALDAVTRVDLSGRVSSSPTSTSCDRTRPHAPPCGGSIPHRLACFDAALPLRQRIDFAAPH